MDTEDHTNLKVTLPIIQVTTYSECERSSDILETSEPYSVHLPNLKSKQIRTIRVPSVNPIPRVIPESFEEALELVQINKAMFYLSFKFPPSHIFYNPYDYRVVKTNTSKDYAILSDEGITQIIDNEVTFIPTDRFLFEKEIFAKLRKLSFFRYFRLRKSWLKWRKRVRTKRMEECRKNVSSTLLILSPQARTPLYKIIELCNELSKRSLLNVHCRNTPTSLVEWSDQQLHKVQKSHMKLQGLRNLILQILVSSAHNENDTDGSEAWSGDGKHRPSSRSQTGSSTYSRRMTSTILTKIVRISDTMLSVTLKDILMNSIRMITNGISKKNEGSYTFGLDILPNDGILIWSPTYDAMTQSLNFVVENCENAVLSCQNLAPHFADKECLTDDNPVLSSMLQMDDDYKRALDNLYSLLNSISSEISNGLHPLQELNDKIKHMEETASENSNGIPDLGDKLRIAGEVLEKVKKIPEVEDFGSPISVNILPAKSYLLEKLRKIQDAIHDEVTSTFERSVDKLQQQATDSWLSLELSPVTAHQLVSLLNYFNQVKSQLEEFGEEEKKISEMFDLIRGYNMVIHQEVETKYEMMKKDMKRLRKTLRRTTMERPGHVIKLKTLLQKEEADIGKETEKLAEQVQALRFLRITSDREEVLKMLTTAERRCLSIREQADIIIQYQKDFQLEPTYFEELQKVETEISLKTFLWRSLFEWEEYLANWQKSKIHDLDASDILSITQDYRRRVEKLKKGIIEKDVLNHFDSVVKMMEIQIPVLESLTDVTLRPRHWEELQEIISDQLSSYLTVCEAEKMHLYKYSKVLVAIAKKARKQKAMEDRLDMVISDLQSATVPIASSYRRDMLVLGDCDTLKSILLNSDIIFHSLLKSKHAIHIKDKTIEWKDVLILAKNTLKVLLKFESEWKELEPVMMTRSAKDTFPVQASQFSSINVFWKNLATKFQYEPPLVKHLKQGVLLEQLRFHENQVIDIMSCLEPLLAMRRSTCPRLYLLSDQDLLQLLTRAQEQEVCEEYLPRIFKGVASLRRNSEDKIASLISHEREVLKLSKPVLAHHGVEDWMGRVESAMQATLKRIIITHIDDSKLSFETKIPLQAINVCKTIQWTNEVDKILDQNGTSIHTELRKIQEKLQLDAESTFKCEYVEPVKDDNTLEATTKTKGKEDLKVAFSKLKRTRKVTLFMMKPVSFSSGSSFRSEVPESSSKIKKKKRKKLKLPSTRYLFEISRSSYILNLIDLRDTTKLLSSDHTISRHSFKWKSMMKYRPAFTYNTNDYCGLQIQVQPDLFDYGYEYFGVSSSVIQTPLSQRSSFNLATASLRNKCGVICGDLRTGKTETVKRVAKMAGYFLAILDCTPYTPLKWNTLSMKITCLDPCVLTFQTLRQVLSGCIQGGLWLLLKNPTSLDELLIQSLTQSIINIHTARDSPVKRCIIDGQEMKLLESFSVFCCISPSNEAANQLTVNHLPLNEPIAPFLEFYPTSLPTFGSTTEAILLMHGLNFPQDVRFQVKQKILDFLNITGLKLHNLSRILKRACALWIKTPKSTNQDTFIDTLEPIFESLGGKNIMELDTTQQITETNRTYPGEKSPDFNPIQDNSAFENALLKHLLEKNYGDLIISDSYVTLNSDTENHRSAIEDLNIYELQLFKSVVKLKKIMDIQQFCVINGETAFKSTVIKVLQHVLNQANMKQSTNDSASGDDSFNIEAKSRFISSLELYIGSYTDDELLGYCDVNTGAWKCGIFMHIFEQMSQMCATVQDSQQWLIIKGPMQSTNVSKFIFNLHNTQNILEDQGLFTVAMEASFRVILDLGTTDNCDVTEYPNLYLSFHHGEESTLPQPEDSHEDKFNLLSTIQSPLLKSTLYKLSQHLFENNKSNKQTTPESYLNQLVSFVDGSYSQRLPEVEASWIEEIHLKNHIYLETEEFQAVVYALKTILKLDYNAIVYANSGQGLSTLAGYIEKRLKSQYSVLRYKVAAIDTVNHFTCFLKKHLFQTPTYQEPYDLKLTIDSSSIEQDVEESDNSPASGTFLTECELTSGNSETAVVIVEDFIIPKYNGTQFHELLRSMIETGRFIVPESRELFKLSKVLLVLLGAPPKLDMNDFSEGGLISKIHGNVFPIKLADSSSKTRQKIVTYELKNGFVNAGDEGQLIIPVKKAITKFHELLTIRSLEILSSLSLDASLSTKLECIIRSRSEAMISDFPNLTHIMRLVKSVLRYKHFLELSPPEAGAFVVSECVRIYGLNQDISEAVRSIAEEVTAKCFGEAVQQKILFHLAPRIGFFDIFQSKDFDTWISLDQWPPNMKRIALTQHFANALHKISYIMSDYDPTTNLLLVGPNGIGKTSMVQCVSQFLNFTSIILSLGIDKNGRLKLIQDAVLTCILKCRTVLLVSDTEDLNKFSYFPYIFDLITHGWCDALWEDSYVRGLLHRMQNNEQEQNWHSYMDKEEQQNLMRKMIHRVKQNLRVCVIGKRGKLLTEFLSLHKTSPMRMTTLYLETWPDAALREACSKLLKKTDIPQHAMAHTSEALLQIYYYLKTGSSSLNKNEDFVTDAYVNNEITVPDFLECCRVFTWCLHKRKTMLREELNMYHGGMTRLQSTTENIDELRSELAKLEPELKKVQEQSQKLTQVITQQRNSVAEIRNHLTEHDEKLREKMEYLNQMNEEINNEIKETLPELESAERQIKVLDKKDLVEVRVLNNPPDLVLQVMSGICLLLNVKGDWPSMKTLLGEPNMTRRLIEVDKETIGDAVLRKLKKIVENPKFTPDEVAKFSKPCRPLCVWLRALDHYTQVLRNVEPRKARVMESERDLNNLQLEQRQLQQKLGQAERNLSEQGARYDACICRKQQLEGAAKRASSRLQRCTRLTTVLADEHTRWINHVQLLEDELQRVDAECMLASSTVAYLGHLSHNERNEILGKCILILKNHGMKIDMESFSLLKTLSTKEERLHWINAGLDNDPIPLTQAAAFHASHRIPLVLDPSEIVVDWLKKMAEAAGGPTIIHYGEKYLHAKLRKAYKSAGMTVVLHYPLLEVNSKMKHLLQEITDDLISCDIRPSSRLALISGSRSTNLPSGLRVITSIVSFVASPRVLEERFLNEVFRWERGDLFDQRTTLNALLIKDEDALTNVDISILKRLTSADSALLDNEELLTAFYEAKSTAAEHRTRLAESKRTMQKIGNARDKYRPVAVRGRILIAVKWSMYSLKQEYVFSLQHFTQLFNKCISSGGGDSETMSFDQRIEHLVRTLTRLVCDHVIKGLHPIHRLVFFTLLATSVAFEQGKFTQEGWNALRSKNLDNMEQITEVSTRDPEMQTALNDLQNGKTVKFSINELNTDIKLLDIPFSGTAHARKLPAFSALLLLRLSRPTMHINLLQLMDGLKEAIKSVLADPTCLDIDLSIKSLLSTLHRNRGILVWTNYAMDILGDILEEAECQGMKAQVRIFVAPTKKADSTTTDIVGAIKSAMRTGGWIVVQGIFGSIWQDELLVEMAVLNSSIIKVHDDYRLILTTNFKTTVNEDLILNTRLLCMTPSLNFRSILCADVHTISNELYENHYQGSEWRCYLFFAAAVHAVVLFTQDWNRTSVNHTETESHPSNWIQMKDFKAIVHLMYQQSLNSPLNWDTLIGLLDDQFGRKEIWNCLLTFVADKEGIDANGQAIPDFPKEIGIVSKSTAKDMIHSILSSKFHHLHSLAMKSETEQFLEALSSIPNHLQIH